VEVDEGVGRGRRGGKRGGRGSHCSGGGEVDVVRPLLRPR